MPGIYYRYEWAQNAPQTYPGSGLHHMLAPWQTGLPDTDGYYHSGHKNITILITTHYDMPKNHHVVESMKRVSALPVSLF
ncbi:hypothetical protein [Erwinia psidii]|uniref:Uncharacterized protein n=1 Tax=Erwinia psidii TaxID=69224 RepID=A0A3N6SEW7_9GAMM|nr:hypothetical protein [Erwinia psidii]MCX8956650.1 hypothetical protein [Erwinia psidii]MCX8961440.1 hypothetical protein [Erwinia psidii]MCX8965092.1 hypothetical protein [Erwinia psidii]RQM39980.1 hypothetical protein EB241_01325 [Erwinia psidii]